MRERYFLRHNRYFSIIDLPPILKKSLWGRGTAVASAVDEGIIMQVDICPRAGNRYAAKRLDICRKRQSIFARKVRAKADLKYYINIVCDFQLSTFNFQLALFLKRNFKNKLI